jgi:PAS domain S-box-containing protein
VFVRLLDGAATAAALPESLIRYAIRTRETVILDDASSSQDPFASDPCIAQCRSILCLPLINQGKLIGILHLENNLTPRVFTPQRVTVLKVLASQAAISLENTRLYRDLADREGKIRRLVDANIVGIFVADLDGRIFEANDAFLHIVGYDREDLVSGRLRRNGLTPAEWRERDERALAELRSTGRIQLFEKEYFRKDGSRVRARFDRAQAGGSVAARVGIESRPHEPRRHDGRIGRHARSRAQATDRRGAQQRCCGLEFSGPAAAGSGRGPGSLAVHRRRR